MRVVLHDTNWPILQMDVLFPDGAYTRQVTYDIAYPEFENTIQNAFRRTLQPMLNARKRNPNAQPSEQDRTTVEGEESHGGVQERKTPQRKQKGSKGKKPKASRGYRPVGSKKA